MYYFYFVLGLDLFMFLTHSLCRTDDVYHAQLVKLVYPALKSLYDYKDTAHVQLKLLYYFYLFSTIMLNYICICLIQWMG